MRSRRGQPLCEPRNHGDRHLIHRCARIRRASPHDPGTNATHSIGKGAQGTIGTVTIGGKKGAKKTSPYTYKP